MDLLKVLKRTTILSALSAVTVLALGATQSQAATDKTAVLSYVSASVVSTLAIADLQPMNFGDFAIACGGGTGNCDGGANIVLSDQGLRTATSDANDIITLMYGASQTPAGISNVGATGYYETGAQHPGFYNITGISTAGATNIYVTFANSTGQIIDPNQHPSNTVTLTGPTANAFTVDTFTFSTDDNTTGYVGTQSATDPTYGQYVSCTSSCYLRVGATLHTVNGIASPTPGQYTGSFYVMVSY